MTNLTTESVTVEEGVEEPILFTFGPYGYVRYRCPLDGQPMENQTREFSTFGVGAFRCLGGHEWNHDSGRLWTHLTPIAYGEVRDRDNGLRALGIGDGHTVTLFPLDSDDDIPAILAKFSVPADTAVAS